jgi:hypothetical protein
VKYLLSFLAVLLATGCSSLKTSTPPPGLPVRYHNAQYDLTFFLPASWRGYSVLIDRLDDEQYSPAKDKEVIMAHSPMIMLRNPQWQTNAPYQDIPILVFTHAQWDAVHRDGLWPSCFAGGVIDELWHNQKYVFAMNSRTFGFADDLKCWKETADVVEQNCAANKMPPLYAE